MGILLNPITISVIVMCILCLLKVNVLFSLIIAGIVAGVMSGIPIIDTFNILVNGMGGNSQTALSYLLLGIFAAALAHVGLTDLLSEKISHIIKGRKIVLIFILVISAIISGTLIPVHIAFIPILVPPLIAIMNQIKFDRRLGSCALAFGLKATYITIPFAYGNIFQGLIADNMTANGMLIMLDDIWKSTWILGIGMVTGLVLSILFYWKDRDYKTVAINANVRQIQIKWERKHTISVLSIIVTIVVQLYTDSMPLGAICGLTTLILFGAIKLKECDPIIQQGLSLMGLIAFVMLIASGYSEVIKETGAVESLTSSALLVFGGNKIVATIVMILIGLITTMGIGTSFGTVPILAAIYVPMAQGLGFSTSATVVLIATAAALGDAGSPASDTTLGPTSGLNADEQHNHIWDTCIPTFIFYNIPLMIFGFIGAMLF